MRTPANIITSVYKRLAWEGATMLVPDDEKSAYDQRVPNPDPTQAKPLKLVFTHPNFIKDVPLSVHPYGVDRQVEERDRPLLVFEDPSITVIDPGEGCRESAPNYRVTLVAGLTVNKDQGFVAMRSDRLGVADWFGKIANVLISPLLGDPAFGASCYGATNTPKVELLDSVSNAEELFGTLQISIQTTPINSDVL